MTPRPDSLARILVRRLKSELRDELGPNADGTPRFAQREVVPIEVRYPDDERQAHAKLARYAELRRKHAGSGTARSAADFVTLLLKKRLFSSPAAFAHTLDVHLRTVARQAAAATVDAKALQEAFARLDDEVDDDSALTEATEDALAAAARTGDALDAEELELLRWLSGWANDAKGRPDAKAERLLDWLEATCTEVDAGGQRWWNDERVIVFTEYRDTQNWLEQLLTARGLGGDRLALLYGGMDAVARERIKGEFQHAPRPLSAADPAGHRRGQRGDRPPAALPPDGSRRDPVLTHAASSSATAASTATASLPPRCSSTTSWARGGSGPPPAAWRPISASCRSWPARSRPSATTSAPSGPCWPWRSSAGCWASPPT